MRIELGKSAFALAVEHGGRTLRFERAELLDPARKLTAEALQLTLDGGVSEASARLRIASAAAGRALPRCSARPRIPGSRG